MDMMRAYLNKMYHVFLVSLCAIILLEMGMALRGLLSFDLTRLKLRLYLSSYLFLLAVSAESLAALLIWNRAGRGEKHLKMMVGHTYLYAACLLIWGAFVSGLDCIAHGDSGVMVFVMIGMTVGLLMRLKPGVFMAILGVCAAVMLWVVQANLGKTLSAGFYVNYIIFLLLAWFLCLQSYRLSFREMKTADQLMQLSVTDQLTGIYNRRQLDEHIEQYSAEGRRYLFILIDLDNFKGINDRHGHAAGDACLALVARCLKEAFGETTYRYGGDEFAIMTDRSSKEAAAMLDGINRELIGAYPGISLHLSAGLLQVTAGMSPNEAFIRADRMLYQAKHAGKNQCVIDDGR